MEHVAALMFLIGCGHGDIDCREIPAPFVGYETVEACEADMPSVLKVASSEFPVAYGQCTFVDPVLFEQDAVIAWEFGPNGDLLVSVEPADSLLAAAE
jgi:hypothetical protein